MQETKKLDGDSQKKLTFPKTSSERSLENSEIVNSKNSFFCYSDVCTKIKNKPNQKQNKNLDLTQIFCESDRIEIFVKKSKSQPFKNLL